VFQKAALRWRAFRGSARKDGLSALWGPGLMIRPARGGCERGVLVFAASLPPSLVHLDDGHCTIDRLASFFSLANPHFCAKYLPNSRRPVFRVRTREARFLARSSRQEVNGVLLC
jgi:hypothetical protein